MSKSDPRSLQIHPDAGDPVLAQQQELFNSLVRDLAVWRALLAEWEDRMARYHQAVEPVRRELQAAWRDWVFALDHASLQAGLSRAERRQLSGLLREAAAPLLECEDDPELAAVAGRHAEDASAAASSAQEEVRDEAAVEDWAGDWERQAAEAAAQRAEWAAQRRAASAANRRKKEEQDVSRSVRDVYRRLASALHPDREPDANERERKTALMQQANQAHAAQNLLALLELQLQAEQIDAAHLAAVDRRRLRHYVAVLQEQLADLQREARRLEAGFREVAGLAPGFGLQSRKADRLISALAQEMRGDLDLLRRQVRALQEVDDLKAWLRERLRAQAPPA